MMVTIIVVVVYTQLTLLTTTQVRLFDPYNLASIREIRNIDCVVLIHQSDLSSVQRIPNLLKLKRDLRVKFLTYASLQDVKNRNMTVVFPRGGLTVFDDASICNCSPGKCRQPSRLL